MDYIASPRRHRRRCGSSMASMAGGSGESQPDLLAATLAFSEFGALILGLLSLIPIGLSFTAATFPGELLDELSTAAQRL
jgi:hypothetical protein